LSILDVEVPRALAPLLKPARYKGAYGGRGGAKSHFFAEQLLFRCRQKRTRAACIREVQNTIKDSVRQLLIDKIQKLGLGGFFEVLEREIRGKNGSLIIFKGMQAYNAENIKSLEDFDIAWVEEAQTLSEKSLRLLRPTIRKDGSELWFSWNPRHDTDAVDHFFRGGGKRSSMITAPVNWQDNPWFPRVLIAEKNDDFANDPEMAEHVWNGGYEIITEGSYYAKLLAAAERDGRIGDFPYNPLLPVHTAWDIGVDDYTSIWFFQSDGYTVTAIDFFEISNAGAPEIVSLALPELLQDLDVAALNLLEMGRREPYSYGRHFLPHDVKVREWGAGAKQRSLTLLELGVKPLNVGVATNPADRINATRQLLPLTRFNNTSKVQSGISRLRRYARKMNDKMGIYMGPLHDDNSHAADAFGEFAINCGIKPPKPAAKPKPKANLGQVYIPGPPKPRTGVKIKV
jgi:phage terminase large subunit